MFAAGSALLAGCRSAGPVLPPTGTPSPGPATAPVQSELPASAALATARPDVIKIYPAVKSRVVCTRDARVWKGDDLDAAEIARMLDASISGLTGINDPARAWSALFSPAERVAIKVNAIANGSTHLALVLAVAERLQTLGIPPEHITLYDRTTRELSDSGFPVNRRGAGMRCYGTDGEFTAGWKIADQPVRLSPILAECDALINLPVLKAFTLGGLSFGMKNHYGSVEAPDRFHDSNFAPGITGLNALEPIRRRTRLIIGDILSEKSHKDLTNYAVVGGVDGILTSFDPIAHDAVGLQMARQSLEPLGLDLDSVNALASDWLQAGAALGLGTNDPAHIDLVNVDLS